MRSFGSVLAVLLAALVVLTTASAVAADDTEDYTSMDGFVYSVIKGADTYLEGAKIVLTGEDGITYKAQTNSEGYFILSCPAGTYPTMLVECGGFDAVTMENVTARSGYVIQMELRDTTILWGMDAAHVLEFVGLMMVLGILVVGAIMIRLLRKSSKITVINDADDPLGELDELEELEQDYEGEEYVYDDDIKES